VKLNIKNYLKLILIIQILLISNFGFSQYTFDWAYTYGGGGWDESTCLTQMPSGDIFVAGSMRIVEENTWLLRIGLDGKAKWGKTFKSYYISKARDIILTKDTNLVMAGYTIDKDSVTKNMWIIKIDTLGNTIWERNLGQDFDDEAYSIINTQDNGYAVAGYKTSLITVSKDWWVLKLDEVGNIQWEKQFGGSKEDIAKSVAELDDGSIVVTGFAGTAGGGYRSISVIRIASDGTELWYKVFRVNEWDEATSIIKTYDNNIVVGGFTKYQAIKDYDAVIIKMTAEGDTLWQRVFGQDIYKKTSTSSTYQKKIVTNRDLEYWDEASEVIESYDNGIIVGGFSKLDEMMKSSFMILKYDKEGNLIFYDYFNRKSLDISSSIIETIDNALIVSGVTYSIGNAWDYALLKYSSKDRSTITIFNPMDSITSSTSDTLALKYCIKSFKTPQNLQIFDNEQLVDFISTMPIRNDEDNECPFLFEYKLVLEFGKNEIEIKVLDEKGYYFSAFKTIYYYPEPAKTW